MISEKGHVQFEVGLRFREEQEVVLCPVDAKTLQGSTFVKIAKSVSLVKRSGTCNTHGASFHFFNFAHSFAERFRGVDGGDILSSAVKKIFCISAVESFLWLWFEVNGCMS